MDFVILGVFFNWSWNWSLTHFIIRSELVTSFMTSKKRHPAQQVCVASLAKKFMLFCKSMLQKLLQLCIVIKSFTFPSHAKKSHYFLPISFQHWQNLIFLSISLPHCQTTFFLPISFPNRKYHSRWSLVQVRLLGNEPKQVFPSKLIKFSCG